jgi:hypothetical protein
MFGTIKMFIVSENSAFKPYVNIQKWASSLKITSTKETVKISLK